MICKRAVAEMNPEQHCCVGSGRAGNVWDTWLALADYAFVACIDVADRNALAHAVTRAWRWQRLAPMLATSRLQSLAKRYVCKLAPIAVKACNA